MTQQRIKPAYAKFDPAHVFDGLFVPTKGKKRGRLTGGATVPWRSSRQQPFLRI